MPKKEELYLSKVQIQRLCELYQEEEHLWNIQSSHYFKKDKKNMLHLKGLKKDWRMTMMTFPSLQVLFIYYKIYLHAH